MKGGMGGVFLPEPGVEALVDGFGEGFQDGLLGEGEADEGDKIGEAAGLGTAVDLLRRNGGEGVPEAVFGPGGVVLAQFGFQLLEHRLCEAVAVGAAVEDLKGRYFGLVFLDVGAEGLGDLLRILGGLNCCPGE